MRRLMLLIILAAAVLLLSACAGISMTYKNTPTALTPGADAHPTNSGQAAAASDSATVSSEQPTVSGGNSAPVTGAQPAQNNGAAHKPEGTAEPAVKAESGQPPLLTEMVQKAELSFDDIMVSQLVLIAADGAQADIYCYDKNDSGIWRLNEDTGYIKGYVGKNGISADKREGDGRTPAGLFELGYAFGNAAVPETGMEYKAVTAESYWVDDPDSQYYNKWVEGTADADWNSAEHLSKSPKSYAYAVVVEYNTVNTVPGKGSAVFLHCKNEPTTGCIAAPREAILKILKWLSEEKHPGMLIVGR